MGLALDRLQNLSPTHRTAPTRGVTAYALYVLARNGRACRGVALLRGREARSVPTVLAKAHSVPPLMLGDKPRAEACSRRPSTVPRHRSPVVIARNDFGSGHRDGAALVTLAMETGLYKQTPKLVIVIAKAYSRGSTPRRRSRRGCCWPRMRSARI